MADNTVLNSGTGGDTIATDDIAGVKHQRVKIQYGTDGSATDVSDSNPLPIDDAGGSLTVDGTVTADAGTGPWPVTDNAGSLTVDNTNIDNLHSADFDTGAGTDTTSAVGIAVPASGGAAVVPGDATAGLKVDLGADNDVTVTGTVTVDGSGVTQPVSAASLPLPSGAATAANQLPDGHNVTVDNAAGASAVNIQDGGNSITVDGTVTANLSATDNAVLDQIEVNTSYGDSVGGGTEAAALRVTIANNSTGLVSVDDNGGSLSVDDNGGSLTVDGTVTADAGTGPWPVTDNGGSLTVDNGGTFAVQSTLQTGSNLVGDVGLSVRTSGGTTLYKNIDVDESEDQIKATAGQVYWIHAINLSSSPLYLKFYDNTAATVVVGTTVPDLTFPLPTQGDTNGAGFTLSIPNGIAFGTAITIAATTGVADNDSGAPGANAVVVNLGYA